MLRRSLVFVGVLLAVGGFGMTRWVAADLAIYEDNSRVERWEMGPRLPPELQFQIKQYRGTPRRTLTAVGWAAAAIGAGITLVCYREKPPAA